MKEKRSNIDTYNEEFKLNKNAFDDVIGDPFKLEDHEQVQGNYMKLQCKSSIRVANNNFDMGKATKNPAQPNIQDFLCDVERIIELGLGAAYIVANFYDTYIYESSETAFTPKERTALEQKLGRLFRTHKLSPVSKYFTTTRQSVGSINERNRRNGSSRNGTCKLSL